MTICIAGKNNIAVNAVEYLMKNYSNHTIIVCINRTDNGENNWQKSLKFYASQWGIPILKLNELYEIEDLLFLSLEFDRIIRVKKFQSNNLYNIHFSKLPSYKGMFTSVMPLLNGEDESGVTLHKMEDGIDTGDIIDQITFPLSLNTSARNLYDFYIENGFKLFKKNLDGLIEKDYKYTRQGFEKSSYYSKSALDFSNLDINLNKTAFEIHNQIRAYCFREYQLPSLFGSRIYRSEITQKKSQKKPGVIVEKEKSYFIISTIDYDLKLYIDFQEELFTAVKEGDIDTIHNLREVKYPIDIRSKEGWDILIVSCYYNRFEVVNYLINQGWNVNTTNYKGTTALMYAMTAACEGRGIECFRTLLQKSDVSRKDQLGNDIYFYAKKYDNPQVLNLLNV